MGVNNPLIVYRRAWSGLGFILPSLVWAAKCDAGVLQLPTCQQVGTKGDTLLKKIDDHMSAFKSCAEHSQSLHLDYVGSKSQMLSYDESMQFLLSLVTHLQSGFVPMMDTNFDKDHKEVRRMVEYLAVHGPYENKEEQMRPLRYKVAIVESRLAAAQPLLATSAEARDQPMPKERP